MIVNMSSKWHGRRRNSLFKIIKVALHLPVCSKCRFFFFLPEDNFVPSHLPYNQNTAFFQITYSFFNKIFLPSTLTQADVSQPINQNLRSLLGFLQMLTQGSYSHCRICTRLPIQLYNIREYTAFVIAYLPFSLSIYLYLSIYVKFWKIWFSFIISKSVIFSITFLWMVENSSNDQNIYSEFYHISHSISSVSFWEPLPYILSKKIIPLLVGAKDLSATFSILLKLTKLEKSHSFTRVNEQINTRVKQ